MERRRSPRAKDYKRQKDESCGKEWKTTTIAIIRAKYKKKQNKIVKLEEKDKTWKRGTE
jgi:hypothetical protein